MGCGVESVMLSSTGVLTMPEWCAGSWGSLKRVRFHMLFSPISICFSYVQVHMFLTMSRDLEQVKEVQ